MAPTSPKLIRKPDLLARVPLGYDTILRLTKKGKFPKAVKIPDSHLVCWYEHEIDAWLASLERGTGDFKPRRARARKRVTLHD